MTTQNNEETDSFKTIKTQMGSTKTFKGFKYSVYSCFKRPATWWQSEIEKGNVVYSQTFRPETLLKDMEDKIFNKIDKCEGVDVFSTRVKLLELWKAEKSEEQRLKKIYNDFVISTHYLDKFPELKSKIKNHKSESPLKL